jgi:C-terminal processing protease CtpA/Prc
MTGLNKKHHSLLLILGALVLLCSCEVQDILPAPDTTPEEQGVNGWIEQTMRLYYLWEEEIPESKQLNFAQEADPFFTSLLSRKDGKTQSNGTHYFYSSINRKSDSSTKSYMGEAYSFGFEYQYYYIRNLEIYALLTLYVLPGSPAEQAGMKRGDWIVEINDKAVPGDAQSLLDALDTASPVTVSFGIAKLSDLVSVTEKTLTAAKVTDNPVFVNKVITYGRHKVAYLVYNHFTAGPTEKTGDEAFNLTLRDAFRDFKAAQPDAFVLDLRYNGGGLVSCAQLLATLLAPASALDDVFCKLTYNGLDNKYPKQQELMLDSKLAGSENLNLNTLYVITSQRTASASEAVINGLKPYLKNNLIIIGDTTEGKNVGSITFDDEAYEWELHPIVSRLSNKEGFSDYGNGIAPDIFRDENHTDNTTYYDLGDSREFILKPILEYIAYGTPLTTKGISDLRPGESPLPLLPLYNSLDRKKANGVVLDR